MRDPGDDVDDSDPDDSDFSASDPSGLGPGDSLSPIPPLPPRRAAEVKVRQVKPPAVHPVVKYGGIGGLLAFLGGLAWYLISWFHGGTRP
jgi:hypothetical protein